MTTILNIADVALERRLERLMERIKEAQDAETRKVLWGEFKDLHAKRTAEQVSRMESGWAE